MKQPVIPEDVTTVVSAAMPAMPAMSVLPQMSGMPPIQTVPPIPPMPVRQPSHEEVKLQALGGKIFVWI